MKKVKKKNEDCKRYSPSSEFTPNYCGSQEGVAKFTYHLIPDFILVKIVIVTTMLISMVVAKVLMIKIGSKLIKNFIKI